LSQLSTSPGADAVLIARWHALAQRLGTVRRQLEPADFDKEQLNDLHNALWRIRELLDADPDGENLDLLDELLVTIEQIRHIVRDALDEHVPGVSDDVGLVLRDVKAWLPQTPNRVLADLAGVDRRTLSRWAKQPAAPPRRFALVARLVAVLRHSWTEPGVVAWFDRPRRDLGGRRPGTLLDDPNREEDLLAAARSGRSQYAD
jgi:transcriptional regulator with XRE-family HTH domain